MSQTLEQFTDLEKNFCAEVVQVYTEVYITYLCLSIISLFLNFTDFLASCHQSSIISLFPFLFRFPSSSLLASKHLSVLSPSFNSSYYLPHIWMTKTIQDKEPYNPDSSTPKAYTIFRKKNSFTFIWFHYEMLQTEKRTKNTHPQPCMFTLSCMFCNILSFFFQFCLKK
jgi:hypothetical protein